MRESPLVTVVMPAYNAARFIERAIESVLSQSYSPTELIVVDDGSTDATPNVVSSFLDRLTYIRQPNARQAAARNRGVDAGRGDLLAFIDADDEWMPEKLAAQVAYLEKNPTVSAVVCGVIETDESGRSIRNREAWIDGEPRRALLLGTTGGGICGSTPLIRASAFEALGGFDEDLPPVEDTDLLWRVACQGEIGVIPEPLVRYRLHASNAHSQLQPMTIAWKRFYAKALSSLPATADNWTFRAACRGRLYYMLAGCHITAKEVGPGAYYALAACLWWPPSGIRILRHLVRRPSA